MNFTESFGEKIRRHRENMNLPLRKVASSLDIDPSLLSKMEKNLRKPNKNLIKRMAEFYKLDESDLLKDFYSDQIVYKLIEEQLGIDTLRLAEQKLEYIKKSK